MSAPGEPDWKALSAEAAEAPHEVSAAPENVAAVAPVEAETPDAPLATSESPASEVAPSSEATPEVLATPTPASKPVHKLADDDLVEVKIDGEPAQISYGQYKDILRRNATVTQREQNIAQTRKELNDTIAQWQAHWQEREAALQATQQPRQSDPVQQALLDLLQGKQPAKPKDPNEVLTIAEMEAREQALRKEMADLAVQQRSEFDRDMQLAQKTAQQIALQQKTRQEFFGKVDQIAAKPEYAAIAKLVPNVKAHIEHRLNTLVPNTEAEALQAVEDWFSERREIFETLTVAQKQTAEAAAVKNKMESNAGSTPAIKGTTKAERVASYVGKNGKPNWAKMFEDAQKHSMQ